MALIKTLAKWISRPALAILAIVAAISGVELAIADRKYGLFSGGFGQSNAVSAPAELALFLAGYIASQIAAALLVRKLCNWLNRRNTGWPSLYHFTFAFGGLNLAALNTQYQLHSYLSDAADFALMKQMAGGSIKEALLFGKNEIALAAAVIGVFALIWWGGWRLLKRIIGVVPAQSFAAAGWWRLGIAWLAFLALLAIIPRTGSDAAYGLDRMIVWNAADKLAAQATDFDSDGYGLFGVQLDRRPFDSTRHPLALDIPGNGVDEDGYGGDLALVAVPAALPETAVPKGGPNVVLVVFESTRADVLGKRIDGKPVAPILEALAAEGAAIAPSYSHVGFTTDSLKSVFSGKLSPRPGDPSLFVELKKAGYRISIFSGQPEDFGDISAAVGMRKNADIFVDAETLKDQRAFSFAAQGSLLVDEGILLSAFDRNLGKPEDWKQPQFVYFNFQSPHFPYDHPGVPHRLANPPIARSDIKADNRTQVERTYWNAVANADARLGELIARLKRLGAWDNTILMVTGDHGEALFEDGFLGHGHIINNRQFATFLVSNRSLPGVAAPIVISDYRSILLGLLTGTPPARSQALPFMHIGELRKPSTIGMAGTPFGIVSLRLDSGRACFERPAHCRSYGNLSQDERSSIDALAARWGSERWAAVRAVR